MSNNDRNFLCRMAFETTDFGGCVGEPEHYGFKSYEEMYDFVLENVEIITNPQNPQRKLLHDDIVRVNSEIDFFAMDLSSAYCVAEHIVNSYRE